MDLPQVFELGTHIYLDQKGLLLQLEAGSQLCPSHIVEIYDLLKAQSLAHRVNHLTHRVSPIEILGLLRI